MGVLDYLEAAKLIGGLLLTFVAIISGLIVWMRRRMAAVAVDASSSIVMAQTASQRQIDDLQKQQAKADGQIDDLERDVDAADRRLSVVESNLRGMPTREDIHALTLSMARMEGQFEKFEERLKPVTHIMERMQELLMQNNSKESR